jgi:uncharacterized protein
MAEKKVLDWIAYIVLIIGGLNWGLIGLLNFDLIAFVFSSFMIFEKIIYLLIGISALYVLYCLIKKNN